MPEDLSTSGCFAKPLCDRVSFESGREIRPSTLAVFDYGALDADVATLARQSAKRIGDRTRSSFIENGRDLIAVKAKLEHDMFSKWLKAEFPWSERTAQSMMNAAGLADK